VHQSTGPLSPAFIGGEEHKNVRYFKRLLERVSILIEVCRMAHFRIQRARIHRIDPDPLMPHFVRQRLRKSLKSKF